MEDTQSTLTKITANKTADQERVALWQTAEDIIKGTFISQSNTLKAQYEGEIETLTRQNGTLSENLSSKTSENDTLSETLQIKNTLLEEKDSIIGGLTADNTTLKNIVNAVIDYINSKRDLESLPAITQDTLLEEITALI